MQPIVGEIFEGKITGITKFGAFVALPDGKNGLVHISEIANSFVNNVSDHVSEGQTVRVKIIGVGGDGKINLSIKQVQTATAVKTPRPAPERQESPHTFRRQPAPASASEPSFEDKLKQFMNDSDNRISGSRIYSDKKSGYRRKRDT